MNKGFTLVELAIVMTIIGLLIGGVLKGQQLMTNARISSQIKQFQQIEAAAIGFRDAYAYLPGDIPNALQRVRNCNASNFCTNGDGNNIIGVITSSFNPTQAGLTSLPQVETSMFWKHLALADMIAGIVYSANPATPLWGETHMASPLGGGLAIGFNSEYATNPNTTEVGHFLLLSNVIGSSGAPYALSPSVASILDMKIDDGKPNLGSVLAEHVGTSCKTGDGPLDTYNMTIDDPVCVIWYGINL